MNLRQDDLDRKNLIVNVAKSMLPKSLRSKGEHRTNADAHMEFV